MGSVVVPPKCDFEAAGVHLPAILEATVVAPTLPGWAVGVVKIYASVEVHQSLAGERVVLVPTVPERGFVEGKRTMITHDTVDSWYMDVVGHSMSERCNPRVIAQGGTWRLTKAGLSKESADITWVENMIVTEKYVRQAAMGKARQFEDQWYPLTEKEKDKLMKAATIEKVLRRLSKQQHLRQQDKGHFHEGHVRDEFEKALMGEGPLGKLFTQLPHTGGKEAKHDVSAKMALYMKTLINAYEDDIHIEFIEIPNRYVAILYELSH